MTNQSKQTLHFATILIVLFSLSLTVWAANAADTSAAGRERLLMDFGWRFAFGHPYDTQKDFSNGTGFFSYFAKTGNGDGAASANFDDRTWRTLNLPHDWAVEVPFDERGSGSHGFKAIGRNFPQTSVGWYRKSFMISESDLGRRISIEFDGVFRDSQVWVNGFYLGCEPSGYSGFSYDLTEYLNYGGSNTIAVRVDATMEEGWFYEGAGIYRHVWLVKTSPLHVVKWGTFVTTDVKEKSANVTARVTVNNEAAADAQFQIGQTILDADGKAVVSGDLKGLSLKAGAKSEFSSVLAVPDPNLWSCETPYMHTLATTITSGGKVVDRYETPFGIRTIRWDPNEGFFLNGKRIQLKGTCNHQDHAGVGVAIPDELYVFRVEQLKKMGSNAIRTSHNAPAPELLDICDRLGVLIMDENREYGINPHQLNQMERLMVRDRNHPSVIIWSIGNEEWSIEGNEKGTRVTQAMQDFARRLDTTRPTTVAISGGWGNGSSVSIDVMGFNYFTHGDMDKYHAKFPNKPSVGTEDGATFSTRGIYVENRGRQHLTAYDKNKVDWNVLAEDSVSHYAARPYAAGQFQWTGFDYRGEPTPFGWPAISTQFGILDLCGFPKDNFYYYQAWWSGQPMLHLFPHWNWPGMKGQEIDVWVHSNCDEVELFLNDKSLGKKTMKKNSHLEWKVKYEPGTLLAKGFNTGKEVLTDKVETVGAPAAIQLIPHRASIKADGQDVSVITVQVNDVKERFVPTAGNEIVFAIQGPGKIIGVGNGDPSCHEPDVFIEKVESLSFSGWRRHEVDSMDNRPEIAVDFNDADWQAAFARPEGDRNRNTPRSEQTTVYRGVFDLPKDDRMTEATLLLRSLGEQQTVYVNGRLVIEKAPRNDAGHEIPLDKAILAPGKNVVAVIATPMQNVRRDGGNSDMGGPGVVRLVTAPGNWKRSVFNGLAQVIVQSTSQPGEITLTATSEGLKQAQLKIQTQSVTLRPSVPAK